MSEIKFKHGTTVEGKTGIESTDIVMVNNAMLSASTAENYETDKKFGSVYRGDKIVGTTKADELCLTENLKVTGVNVGGVSNGQVFQAGESLDSILKKIFQKEIDATYAAPTVTISKACDNTVEVGKAVDLGLGYSFTDGKYNDSMSAECVAGTPTYFQNNVEQTTTPTKVPTTSEGSYSYKVSVPYSAGKTAAALGITTNLNNPSKTTAPAGTAISTNSVTVTVSKKWYVDEVAHWTGSDKKISAYPTNKAVEIYVPSDYKVRYKMLGMTNNPTATQTDVDYLPESYSYDYYYIKNDKGEKLDITDLEIYK